MVTKDLHLVEEPKRTIAMNPKKFILWLFMVSITMLFAALTSAYTVRQGDGNWLEFGLPNILWISTGVLLLSSATMQWARFAAKKDEIGTVRLATSITLVLGISFLIMQVMGWSRLVDAGVYFVGNPSGSFLYVFTGVHALHLVSGLVFIAIVLFQTLRYKVHSRSMTSISLCTTYWHFLDGLWVYLFIFLLLNS